MALPQTIDVSVSIPIDKPELSHTARHGPLQAGHGWMVEFIALVNGLNLLRHPWVARLKRAMTGVWVAVCFFAAPVWPEAGHDVSAWTFCVPAK
jgi:hypothetical protein